MSLIETGVNTRPKIVTERKGKVSIGRLTIPASCIQTWQSGPNFERFFNALNGNNTDGKYAPPRLRQSLTFSLNNNTPNRTKPLNHERGVSAYFTFNPEGEEVIIEWGTIDPRRGTAKLHTYLNAAIDYTTRVKKGMKLSSGHIARVAKTEDEIYLALLDNLCSSTSPIKRNDPMARLVNALYSAGFIPIAADGSVRLPVF